MNRGTILQLFKRNHLLYEGTTVVYLEGTNVLLKNEHTKGYKNCTLDKVDNSTIGAELHLT